MQYLSIPVLLTFSVASVHATCFAGGASGLAANVQSLLNPICGGLQGFYITKEQRHQCVTDTAGQQWDFTLKVKTILPLLLLSAVKAYTRAVCRKRRQSDHWKLRVPERLWEGNQVWPRWIDSLCKLGIHVSYILLSLCLIIPYR